MKTFNQNLRAENYNQLQEANISSFNSIDVLFELFFYIYLFYTNTATNLGINIRYSGAAIIAVLGLSSFLFSYGKRNNRINYFLVLIFSLVFLQLFMQIIIHKVPMANYYNIDFLVWMFMALFISSQIGNPGFLTRLALVLFLIMVVSLPFVSREGESGAAIGTGTGFANPNDLAIYAGFCVLVFWLQGLQKRALARRFLFGGLAFISFAIMLKTFSRGALLSILVIGIISLRHVSLRQRVGLFLLVSLFGVFCIKFVPMIRSSYKAIEERGTKDDRTPIWIAAVDMMSKRPITGYGVDAASVETSLSEARKTPHNCFLFLGLASGVIPMTTLMLLWLSALKYAYKEFKYNTVKANSFPLILYAFFNSNLGNIGYLSVWVTASLFYCCLTETNNILPNKGG